MYRKRPETSAVVRLSDNAIIGPENENDWRMYQAWLATGNTEEPAEKVERSVPACVPLWAVRVILAKRGLLEEANAAIAASDNISLRTIWEYGNTVDRNSPALLALAEALGVAGEIDDLFIAADEVRI